MSDTDKPAAEHESFILELVPLPGFAAPFAARVRRFLKAAKRQYGLRCARILPDMPDDSEDGGQTR